jgi:hypothetical protein
MLTEQSPASRQAAHDFMKEFNDRKASAPSLSKLFGIPDYWRTWAGMALEALLLLRISRRS